jgi:alpha-L-rhamnosidase
LFPFAVMIAALHGIGQAELVPLDLRSDGLGGQPVASSQPRLSWRVESEKRARSQSAWQILVASSAEVLAKDQGDLWDSGKQAATRSPSAGYGGKRLEPGKVYHWKVRCWDAAGQPSAWSAAAVLEIAPMTPADWSGARWIDDGREQPAKDEDFYQPDPAPLLRQEFTLAKPVVRARLHVAGVGYVKTSLNGQRPLNVPELTLRAMAQYRFASVPGLRSSLRLSQTTHGTQSQGDQGRNEDFFHEGLQ